MNDRSPIFFSISNQSPPNRIRILPVSCRGARGVGGEIDWNSTYSFSEDVVGKVRLGQVRGLVDVQAAVNLDRGRGAVQALDALHLVVVTVVVVVVAVGGVPASSGYRIAQRRLRWNSAITIFREFISSAVKRGRLVSNFARTVSETVSGRYEIR